MGGPSSKRVEAESAVVGRSSRVDITVADRYLSRPQARFFRLDGTWMVEDLGGRNPTLLNGRAVESRIRNIALTDEAPGRRARRASSRGRPTATTAPS
jgi:pSer/pThr/pTyr-binding forkhead associated (FHA) protein